MAWPDRAPIVLAPLIALTVGVGVGASVRPDQHPSVGTRPPAARAHTSAPVTLPDRLLAYAREHAFAFEDPPSSSGAVDRWDPCEPIHYRVHLAVDVPGGRAAIDAAFSQVAAATGMQFDDDGTTDEMPSDNRRDIRRTRAGWAWAPVLVAVVSHQTFRRSTVSSDTVAYAEPDIYSDDADTVSQIVSGEIVVDAGQLSDQGAGDPDGLEPTMLHEIGHLVGLGHIRAPGEIMQPDGGGVVGLGPGDLAGLHTVGSSAGCIVDPALPSDSSDYPK